MWDKIIDVNLSGPMRTIKEAVGPMRASGGGRVVNISSVAGLSPHGSSIAYAVSKSGLNHLTKCMARGLAPDILVNCIAPGYLEGTLMSTNLTPEYRQEAVAMSLLQRAADKDDIARQVVEFCRTDSVTGADAGDRFGAGVPLGGGRSTAARRELHGSMEAVSNRSGRSIVRRANGIESRGSESGNAAVGGSPLSKRIRSRHRRQMPY